MISVVIPAYNEERSIGSCLDALVVQNTKEKFEVVVVDNASTDKTAEVVNSYKKKLPVRLVKEAFKGRSPARRKGFSVAKGNIILSTDADTVVPLNWISELSECFKDPFVSAVTGTCRINDCSPRINFMFNLFQPLAMKTFRIVFGHYWLSGFNFGIKKSVYEKTDGFNPRLNIQEDIDLSFKVARVAKIKFVKSPVVIFSGRRFHDGLVKGLYPYVKSFYDYFFLKNEEKVYLSDVR